MKFNPIQSTVDWQCQICRPTGSGYLAPGTNTDWKREDWNLVEMNDTPCNDNDPRTHTGVPGILYSYFVCV